MSKRESVLEGIAIRLLAAQTNSHTRIIRILLEEAIGDVFRGSSSTSHSVWGRVVPDIPDFCRELIAALEED